MRLTKKLKTPSQPLPVKAFLILSFITKLLLVPIQLPCLLLRLQINLDETQLFLGGSISNVNNKSNLLQINISVSTDFLYHIENTF